MLTIFGGGVYFFFFQAEDGIRDLPVTGVQTCALPISDGIALKQPGVYTLPLLRELLSSLETVSEDEIAAAMVFLAERAKLVAEGAGAVAVAAAMSARLPPREGTTVAIVSGGNVDNGLLASLLRR